MSVTRQSMPLHRTQWSSTVGRAVNLNRARNRTLRMTAVMVAAFAICWTPYFVNAAFHFWDIDYSTGKARSVEAVVFGENGNV